MCVDFVRFKGGDKQDGQFLYKFYQKHKKIW